MYVLERVESLVALELIDLVVGVDVELVATQHRHRQRALIGEGVLCRRTLGKQPVAVQGQRHVLLQQYLLELYPLS